MQRDILLLTEMIDAAEQAQRLVEGISARQLEADRQRRDALPWNFTSARYITAFGFWHARRRGPGGREG